MKHLDDKTTILADAMRLDLGKKNSAVAQACNFDASQRSRLISGGLGITLDKIDSAVKSLGYVVVQADYIEWLQFGCQIGGACKCAAQGLGICGNNTIQLKAIQ